MKESKRTLPGLNIQWPWSERLSNGEKVIETRSYPLPTKYVGQELALIETPGPSGKSAGIAHARVIGTITFGASFRYETFEHWSKDSPYHLVSIDDPNFKFRNSEPKWGWPVLKVRRFPLPIAAPNPRGIIFASSCEIPR